MLKSIEKGIKGSISTYFLMIAVFFLPISREIFVISLWPWIFFLLLESFITKWSRWAGFSSVPVTVYFLPGLFILLLISLLWTENLVEGWNHIGRSTLLMILPILIGFDKGLTENDGRIKMLFRSYLTGTIFSLFLLFVFALFNSFSSVDGNIQFNPHISSWENAFFYDHFSFLIHPTYYGMMVLMAASIFLNDTTNRFLFKDHRIWTMLMGFGLIGSLVLISSRAMIIASILVLFIWLLNIITSRRIRLVAVAGVLVMLVLIIKLHPRFLPIREILNQKEEATDVTSRIEESERGKSWQASVQLAISNPILGLGVGDVKDSLVRFYRENHIFDESKRYLNCHNQFLESWIGAGILAVILLVFMLLYPLFKYQSIRKNLYWSFFLISLTVFLTESVLNRLWGVSFFSLFYILLTTKSMSEK